ncbi:MAG: regulatory protein RecX [Bacteroidales bacterium]|nr:regulatory protein RecX [Bacteroidales bacterium]MDT8374907.1 regulatory protein RecX [Bacteroidales bacterium]
MDDKLDRVELLQKAMKACSGREYCISDIRSMLDRWGAEDQNVKEQIIKKLLDEKFIDEQRYSRAFVLDHFRHSHWGRVKITMGLRNKKVAPEAIASGLEAIDDEEYMALLRKTVEDQRSKIRAKNRYDLKGKLLRHALGRGFESELVYRVINALFDD